MFGNLHFVKYISNAMCYTVLFILKVDVEGEA